MKTHYRKMKPSSLATTLALAVSALALSASQDWTLAARTFAFDGGAAIADSAVSTRAALFLADYQAAVARPKSPVEAKLAELDPMKSYARLLSPTVAARVGLTDAQRERVAELTAERDRAFAGAPKENWGNLTLAAENALKGVLTAEQVGLFERDADEKTVVLSFFKKDWKDVLAWLETEIGVQILADAAPIGRFTHNAKAPLAPREALAAVQSALEPLGYALVRYNGTLILHDFKAGAIPTQYLPKVTPKGLADFGDDDYAALELPLEGRSMGDFRKRVEASMGGRGVLHPLDADSILVVDSVKALRKICAAAASAEEPDGFNDASPLINLKAL
ncbi:MAG: hypothetical protein HUK22_01355 [Thermoguttaceae bacterium]|nr:hypothetical protein [Thermoguttaceae bacterium]